MGGGRGGEWSCHAGGGRFIPSIEREGVGGSCLRVLPIISSSVRCSHKARFRPSYILTYICGVPASEAETEASGNAAATAEVPAPLRRLQAYSHTQRAKNVQKRHVFTTRTRPGTGKLETNGSLPSRGTQQNHNARTTVAPCSETRPPSCPSSYPTPSLPCDASCRPPPPPFPPSGHQGASAAPGPPSPCSGGVREPA